MSATLTAERQGPARVTGRPGVPFGRLVRTELRKLTDTRAGRWLIIAIIAIIVAIVVVALFVAPAKDLTYSKLVDYTQTPEKILLPVIGILAITSEWSQRTGLVTFTLEPNRARVLLAKAAAVLILGVIVIASTFGATAIGNLLGAALRHGNGSWAFGIPGFRDIALVQLTGLVQGMAFGMLLLISAAAIVLYFVPDLLSVALNSITALKHILPWIDLNQAQSPLYTHDMTGKGWAQLLAAMTIWVVVPCVLGIARIRRSEVKSG